MEDHYLSMSTAPLSTICVIVGRWPNSIQFTHLKNGENCGELLTVAKRHAVMYSVIESQDFDSNLTDANNPVVSTVALIPKEITLSFVFMKDKLLMVRTKDNNKL